MQKPIRNTIGRTPVDQSRVATFSDLRQAAPKMDAAPSSIDISAAIRKRPFLAVVPVVLVLLAGAPYALRTVPKEYHAEATVYVSPTYLKNLQGDREQVQISYDTLVNQQILTIRRYDILSEALKKVELEGIRWRETGETESSAVTRLMEKLQVIHLPDSYEVLVGLDGPKADYLAPVVNTVANTYLEKQKGEDVSAHSNRLAALTAAQWALESRLREKLDEQSELSQKAVVANLDKAAPVEDTLLANTRQAWEEARRKRIEAEAQISIMTESTGKDGETALTALAEESVAKDPGLQAQTANLIQRSFELRARNEGLTPQHPLRKATEKELADINEQLVHLPKGLVQDASARLLAKLQAEVARTRVLEGELEKQVQADTSNVLDMAKMIQESQGLNAEIERLRKSEATVNSEIDELTFKGNVPGYVRMFSPAQTPLEPVKSGSKKALGWLAGMAGFAAFLSVGLCVAIDLIDQRIHSPSDVKRAVGFSPVGVLLAPGPSAFAKEHFWRLVNGIRRGITMQEAKCIVVTPLRFESTPGTLVGDIGRALVSSGFKTVIVDANPCRVGEAEAPNVTTVTPATEPHPSSFQKGHSPFPPRIEIGTPRDLSRVPMVGRAGRAGAMLDELKRDYDVVLIDAPPLLLSADTQFLGAIGDITLVVVETGAATRRELVQAADLLKRIGAPGVGVIMSQVRLRYAGRELKEDFKRFTTRNLSTSLA